MLKGQSPSRRTGKIAVSVLLSFMLAFWCIPAYAIDYAMAQENQEAANNESSNAASETGISAGESSLEANSDDEACTADSEQSLSQESFRYQDGVLLYSNQGASTDTIDELTANAVVNNGKFDVFNSFDQFSKGYYTGTDALKGVDVSYANGTIDWSKAKDVVDFAIIQCGYGDNVREQDDVQWINNVRACQKYNIPFGVYLYSYASSDDEHTVLEKVQSEVDHVLACLTNAGLTPNKVALPIYIDLEDEALWYRNAWPKADRKSENKLTTAEFKTQINQVANYFCSAITKAGYEAGVYASLSWFNNYITGLDAKYYRWVAEWNTSIGLTYEPMKDFENSAGVWQFSDYGVVPGISGHVDLNYTYLGASFLLNTATISATGMARNWTGKSLSVTANVVSFDNKTLKEGTDFYLTYQGVDNDYAETTNAPSEVGIYKVIAYGKGDYRGKQTVGELAIYADPEVTKFACNVRSSYIDWMILDAELKVPVRGSNITVWRTNYGANQQFLFEFDENTGYYTIRNLASKNLVLDAAGVVPVNGSNVSAWTENGGLNQKWVLEAVDGNAGFYYIRSAANPNLVLDASGSEPISGSNVSVWNYNGGKNQQWKPFSSDDISNVTATKTGMVKNATGKGLSADFVLSSNGVKLIEGEDYKVYYDNAESLPVDAGCYKVSVKGLGDFSGWMNVGDFEIYDVSAAVISDSTCTFTCLANKNLVLDMASVSPTQGSNISVWTSNGGENQKFILTLGDDGYFTITSAANHNLVLDISGATPQRGANVAASTSNGSLSQKWVLIPTKSYSLSWFNIACAANTNYVLDASSVNPKAGANVSIWTANNGKNQQFHLSVDRAAL